jgi:hypothetical protein
LTRTSWCTAAPFQQKARAALIRLVCEETPTISRQVHGAYIVATMLANGERRLLTFNAGDFRRFEPLIALAVP